MVVRVKIDCVYNTSVFSANAPANLQVGKSANGRDLSAFGKDCPNCPPIFNGPDFRSASSLRSQDSRRKSATRDMEEL
jgi:hypothetical protein